MKLYRNAVILLILLGLLTGAYFYIQKTKKDSPGSSANTSDTIKLVELDTTQMARLTVDYQGDTMVFVRDKYKEVDQDGKEVERDGWKAESPADLKVDQTKMNSLTINLSSVIASKEIEENAQDLAKYGLDKPLTLKAEMKDGTVKSLLVGSETPTKGGYYVKLPDSNKVYTIDSYTGGKLKTNKNALRDSRLFGDLKSDAVTGFAMERNGQIVFTSKKYSATEWNLTSPIQGDVNLTSVQPMLDAVVSSTAVNYIEDKPADLSKYGLDKPSYVLEVESASGRNSLMLGKASGTSGEIYAKLDNSEEVFTVSADVFNFIDKPLKEIVEVFAYLVNISDVNTMTVDIDGRTVKAEIATDKDDKEKDKFVVDGKDVSALKDENDKQYFRTFYSAVIGVTLSDIEPGAKPSGNSEITFTYNLKTAPGTMKVEFIPKDAKSYYVMRNGEYTGILVDKKKFDEKDGVRDTLAKLTEAMAK